MDIIRANGIRLEDILLRDLAMEDQLLCQTVVLTLLHRLDLTRGGLPKDIRRAILHHGTSKGAQVPAPDRDRDRGLGLDLGLGLGLLFAMILIVPNP